ncbi:MAG TPA: PQQ-dependent sugar dehydrogenase [Actinomycetes bacterium]|nr:PQQ-dependent sugar dehydrogenase [Actinomycetes bacterium]
MGGSHVGVAMATTAGQRATATLRLVLGLTIVAAVVGAPAQRADAAAVAVRDGYSLNLVRSGFAKPHAIRFSPDGRLFLLEQDGRVKIVRPAGVTTALTLNPANIIEPFGSAGLLSIAFPPNFDADGTSFVYLQYTHEPDAQHDYPHNVVSRFAITGDTIDPNSEEILIHLDSLIGGDGNFKTMHYGGDMEFGSDGMLYLSTGDLLIGPNARNLNNRYGKILRYTPEGGIPTDNPYYTTLTGQRRAIYSIGLRNPFKLALDTKNGRILIGDVGASNWEEVNVLPPGVGGLDFGWSATEGYTTDPRFVSPVLAYPHNSNLAGPGQPFGCAVMGGDVYRPQQRTFPKSYVGDFFIADHCQGWMRSVDPVSGEISPVLVRGLEQPVDMAVAPNGSVLILQRQLNGTFNGSLLRLQRTETTQNPPTISGHPQPRTVGIGQSATFEVFATGAGQLHYQWQRNGTPITDATGATYTTPPATLDDDGDLYSVIVSNSNGSVTSDDAALTVLDDIPPSPEILSPQEGSDFRGGEVLHIEGAATDAEDGALPPSAFSWDVELHHNTHSHPELGPVDGVTSFDFEVPRETETDPDIFWRIHLRVTDSDGIVTEVTRDVLPVTTTLKLRTIPGGRSLILDGAPVATPLDVTAVVGVNRTLTASPITVANKPMVLDSWSTGELSSDVAFSAPDKTTTFRAFYRVDGGDVGTGTGLEATYFESPDFTDPVLSQVDRVPYEEWGKRRPAPGVPRDNFSVRWSGDLHPQFSETYTFAVPVPDGDSARVVIDGATILQCSGGETVSGSVDLTAGVNVPILIEYSDGGGGAGLKLTWRSSSTPRSAIPGSQLIPPA